MGKRIFDLCAGSGAWSQPYADAGYEVIKLDIITTGDDVRLQKLPLTPVHGILAAPPCTVFCHAGNRYTRMTHEVLDALSVVDACLRFIWACKPAWWALENPMGRLSQYIGMPRYRFQPWWFGDPYTKQTQLWGDFNTNLRHNEVEPSLGSYMYNNVNGAHNRAVTPPGFAKAFFEANP